VKKVIGGGMQEKMVACKARRVSVSTVIRKRVATPQDAVFPPHAVVEHFFHRFLRKHTLSAGITAMIVTSFLSLSGGKAEGAERKPNFLFVFTDDQRWDAMGVVQREMGERGRYPWLQTPHMDRLAEEGIRFRNAFVTLSLCSPSRAAFLTGRYNHLNGIVNNTTPFAAEAVTHASLLRAAGYKTAYIGKWHMGPQRGQRPGFDYSASYIGHGRYLDCPFEINGTSTPTTGWVDDVAAEFAIEFIKQHRVGPFSVVVGFKSAHVPYEPPPRAKDRFANCQTRPVPNLNIRAIYSSDAPALQDQKGKGVTEVSDRKPGLLPDYFRCISAADDALGRLLDVLDELGLADDTVVVFASDNGFYDGEHGLLDKRSVYDESLRIPMLVRYPRAVPKGKVADELVLNIDLAPTFLDLAGAPIPPEMQGRSWKPLFKGKVPDWRTSFLAEYFLENRFPGTPTLVAVRTENAKLIKYPGREEWTELFDLAADPYETKNLVGNPESKTLLERMTAEFDRQVKATDYRVPAATVQQEMKAKKKNAK
jgi:arylsulfatase A-like enzyme